MYSESYNSLGQAKTVRILIFLNISAFIVIHFFPQTAWFSFLGLVPNLVFSRLMVWQVFTYLFLHSGVWHLVINMLMLWMCGSVIENIWGGKRFLFYYLFTGAGAGLCSFAFSMSSSIPVVGASGAVFGLLAAYAVMFPESIILLFLIFPMKMKHAVWVLALINLMGALDNPGSGIAYMAHVGGGLFGFIYLKSEWLRFKIEELTSLNIKKSYVDIKKRKQEEQINSLDEQVDLILDKISKHGINSITKEERKILEKKSRQRV